MTAAPGYLLPSGTVPYPRNLTLLGFIQTVLTGVSGLPGTSVRPKNQVNPPKQPGIEVDWLAFSIGDALPDANAYVSSNSTGVVGMQRHEQLEIPCTIYGPNALSTFGLIRDGFQIPQNLFALRAANIGFTEIARALFIPDLVNERWVTRYETAIRLRREIQRTYPVPILISATGIIYSVIETGDYSLDWAT